MRNSKYIYFVGIGGIGMSAIARYFNALCKSVSGYDLTETSLTQNLVNEGILVHYEDSIDFIPKEIKENKDKVLIIYTPAVPSKNAELSYFRKNDFRILKRAEALGLISKTTENIAVAGTHGKTTVSTLISHILWLNNSLSVAFMGGISKNYSSNLLLSKKLSDTFKVSDNSYTVLEADEYDRSFLNFYPKISLVTSLDADHLDIYGNKNELVATFEKFVSQTKKEGSIIINNKVKLNLPKGIKKYTYSLSDKTDFFAENIRLIDGFYLIDLQTPTYKLENIKIGIPGLINVENSIAAASIAYLSGVSKEIIKQGLETYKGVKRRFDIQISNNELVYIDDYAHHPEEILALVSSVRKMYPDKKITGIFQPHLFSRTQDFASEFAESLSLLDELILMDIYPARELPIEGVTSKIILDKVSIENKILCKKDDVINILKNRELEVLLTIGAGNIDTLVGEINKLFDKKSKEL